MIAARRPCTWVVQAPKNDRGMENHNVHLTRRQRGQNNGNERRYAGAPGKAPLLQQRNVICRSFSS